MYEQNIIRCNNCLNIWANRIINDDKIQEKKIDRLICPLCQAHDVTLIAETF